MIPRWATGDEIKTFAWYDVLIWTFLLTQVWYMLCPQRFMGQRIRSGFSIVEPPLPPHGAGPRVLRGLRATPKFWFRIWPGPTLVCRWHKEGVSYFILGKVLSERDRGGHFSFPKIGRLMKFHGHVSDGVYGFNFWIFARYWPAFFRDIVN